MCFCGDWDFTNPETGLNQAFRADFVRLLGIIASILTLLHYEGKAEIHKNNTPSTAGDMDFRLGSVQHFKPDFLQLISTVGM